RGRPQGVSDAGRGGGEARSPEAGPRAGPVPPAAGSAGVGVLASERLSDLAPAGGLYPPPAGRIRLCRGEDAATAGLPLLGTIRPLVEIPREHVRGAGRDSLDGGGRSGPDRRGRADGAEADELPGAHPDLQTGREVL